MKSFAFVPVGRRWLCAALLLVLASCQLEEPSTLEAQQAAVVPSRGSASTLDFGAWNLEWFGDAGNGPTNEALQLANARDVIAGADLDVWGLEEIVSASQFAALTAQLPGYAGLLANDPSVVNGPAYYSDFGNAEQKVALLYKTSVASVLGAAVILTQNNNDFAGRPPLEVRLRIASGAGTEDIVVIVMHPKCCTDSTSYQRRVTAASALKAYLDATYPTQKVWVIGDFNDDVDTSISTGRASPYQPFVTDTARYLVPTKALSDARISSTVSNSETIDHHVVSNEAGATYVAGSAEVYRVDAYVPSYATTTSDHYPVLSRYTLGGGGGTTPSVTLLSPNGGTLTAGAVAPITWSSSAVANVRLELTTDGGATWSQVVASTPAAAGSYSWTVPAVATSAARVRISDTASTASDTSDAAFTIALSGGVADVVINEILANEPGSNTAGEAIELVNRGTASAALGGWTLSDGSSTRHTFAAGTSLAPGQAIVVFGAASGIPGGVTNAVASSTGSLGLSNSGDSVTLRSAGSSVVGTFTYSSALSNQDGVSMNRSPDGGGAATYVLHTSLSSLASSPGRRASGAAW